MGFAGGGAGRRNSGVRRLADYRVTYETVERIEKPSDELGLRFLLRSLFFVNKMSTPHTFPHLGHPLKSVFSMRRLKVLLVEDDEGARLLYCYMLAAAGFKVNAVRNGLEALAEIQLNRPDVVVTDIAMPVLSGLDLIVTVRSHDEFADLPVVAITSFGEKLREQAREAGATDAIDKPIDITSMREVIEAAVSRSRN